jgi:PIN domain nuclease of toxin-antitoxin system
MRILLDTHTVLWWADGSDQLSTLARDLMSDPQTSNLLSVVTVWEVAIKYHLGRLRIPGNPEEFVANLTEELDLTILPIEKAHAFTAAALPLHHRDPFDRMLIAQAITEQVPILSSDAHLARYPVHVLW